MEIKDQGVTDSSSISWAYWH